MATEILLYSPIYSYTAASFIREMEANKGNDICVRGNCPGGDMYSYNGMVAKYMEHTKCRSVKVDGMAASAFAMFCLEVPVEEVECNDQSVFLFHRAMFGWDLEDEKNMTDVERKELDRINGRARASLEKRVDPILWQAVAGSSIDDLFSMEKRIDVVLNADQAKSLGIVGSVNALTPDRKSEIQALSAKFNIAAFAPVVVATKPNPSITTQKNNNKMTAAEIKAAHPEAYAAILSEGQESERSRVTGWLEWQEIAPKEVTDAISGKTVIGSADISKFSKMALNKTLLAQASKENAPDIDPSENPTAADGTEDSPTASAEFQAKAERIKENMKKRP